MKDKKASPALLILTVLVALLAMAAAGAGLFWGDGGAPFEFTTLHGRTVEMYGQGLYRNDTYFKAPILRGSDTVTLFVALPLLLLTLLVWRRGSLRGGLVLAGVLSYFLYNAASLAFGVAFNELFLVYIAYFSSSLFAFILAFTGIDLATLARRVSPRLPRRGIAAFLVLAGLSVFVWLIDIVGGLADGVVPQGVSSYTTEITYVIDLGIIAPAAFLGSYLVLRRATLGYLLAMTLLILNALVGLLVIAQTVMQTSAGIPLSVGQIIAFVGVFVVMSLAATGLAVIFLRNVAETEMGEHKPAARAVEI